MTEKNAVRENADVVKESTPDRNVPDLAQLDSTPIERTNERSKSVIQSIFDGENPFTIDEAPVPQDGGNGKPETGKLPPNFEGGSPGTLGGVDFEDQPRSDAEYIRKQLEAAGINPDELTVKIGIYEPIYEHAKDHPDKVEDVINHDENGISRGADVTTFSPRETTPEMKLEDHLDAEDPVADFVTDYAVAAMTDMTKFIQDNLLNQDELRVLNVSQGFTSMDPLNAMLPQMMRDPEKYEAVIKDLLGEEKGAQYLEEMVQHLELLKRAEAGEPIQWEPPSALRREFEQALMDKVVATLADNPEFKQAMEDYRDVTKQAAEQGKFIVVAAGNEGDTEAARRLDIPDNNLYNWYAMSDYVVSVGGYDNSGTPFDRTDDKIWSSSSEGTDRYRPDVLAQGVGIPTDRSQSGEMAGTSFSAPAVSTCIALMLEQNLNLTFEQVKEILRNNADPLEGVEERDQGAGVLDIAAAVIEADNSGKVARHQRSKAA